MSAAQEHRFAGARRAEGFDEPADEESPVTSRPALAAAAAGWDRFVTAPAPDYALGTGSWVSTPPQKEAPAQWGAKRRWVKLASLGMASAKPSPQERAHREAEQLIRSASWPRAVRVAVVNPKGGVGKTPAAIILAGVFAQLRGGGVAVWDAGDCAGSLAVRAEGAQSACVSDIAANPAAFSTPGTISSAVARQSSFAAVIGSRRPREFEASDVYAVMQTLDHSFPVSIADTGNVPHSSAFKYVVGYSDAVVIPTAATRDSIDRALDVLGRLGEGPLAGLAQRATIVINRGLGAEEQAAQRVREIFEAQGVGSILDVPFDRAIAAGGELRPRDLSHQSTVAWTQVAAAVASSIVVTQGV